VVGDVGWLAGVGVVSPEFEGTAAGRKLRPDSHPRLWRYINLLLTYLLTMWLEMGSVLS